MKRLVIVLSVLMAITTGCTGLTPDSVQKLPIFDKLYYVIFEGKPEITKDGVFYGDNLEIGKIISQQPGANNLYVTKISILYKHNDMMNDNVVFYVSDGRLTYDVVGESGKPLTESAKILGFTGKPSLYWFKTKSKVKSLSEAAKIKAQELYNNAGK